MSRGNSQFKPVVSKPEVLATPFAGAKKIINDKTNLPTSHSGKPTVMALIEEAIQVAGEIINEYWISRKSWDRAKGNRVLETVNKLKGLLEKDASPSIDPLSRKF